MDKRSVRYWLLGWCMLAGSALPATNAQETAPAPTSPPSPTATDPTTGTSAAASTSGAGGTVGQVVSAPFKDLNLLRTEVPPVLAALDGYPYATPIETDCAGLAREIAALDAVLGADLDAAAVAGKRGRSLAARSLTQAAHSLGPYRSWVRKLTGAEKRDERLAAALITGTTRRAFLKGLGSAQGCTPPAAPLPAEAPPAPPAAAPAPDDDQRPPKR